MPAFRPTGGRDRLLDLDVIVASERRCDALKNGAILIESEMMALRIHCDKLNNPGTARRMSISARVMFSVTAAFIANAIDYPAARDFASATTARTMPVAHHRDFLSTTYPE